jgi:hypothetical protein
MVAGYTCVDAEAWRTDGGQEVNTRQEVDTGQELDVGQEQDAARNKMPGWYKLGRYQIELFQIYYIQLSFLKALWANSLRFASPVLVRSSLPMVWGKAVSTCFHRWLVGYPQLLAFAFRG